MATTNLSDYDFSQVPDASEMKFGIVVSEWNYEITGALKDGAIDSLKRHGVKDENIVIKHVPGSFELIYGCKKMIETLQIDAIIAIGNVIQGETRHFDFVCSGVAQGIKDLNVKYDVPIIFCVLTDTTRQQSIDRSGGKHGNKGIESAIAAIKIAALR